MKKPQKSCFITLEGVDGAGKSTHLGWLTDFLRAAGVDLLCTREPGGTPLGETLRASLLSTKMDVRTETLLMFAARNEHWHSVIQPALANGQWVLCDRFTDASYAYQGAGRGLGFEAIAQLEQWSLQGSTPQLTFLFDVPLTVARQRLRAGRKLADRFELEDEAFFTRTRDAYLKRAHQEPGRFDVIDARQSLPQIRARLAQRLSKLLLTQGFNPQPEIDAS